MSQVKLGAACLPLLWYQEQIFLLQKAKELQETFQVQMTYEQIDCSFFRLSNK